MLSLGLQNLFYETGVDPVPSDFPVALVVSGMLGVSDQTPLQHLNIDICVEAYEFLRFIPFIWGNDTKEPLPLFPSACHVTDWRGPGPQKLCSVQDFKLLLISQLTK